MLLQSLGLLIGTPVEQAWELLNCLLNYRKHHDWLAGKLHIVIVLHSITKLVFGAAILHEVRLIMIVPYETCWLDYCLSRQNDSTRKVCSDKCQQQVKHS